MEIPIRSQILISDEHRTGAACGWRRAGLTLHTEPFQSEYLEYQDPGHWKSSFKFLRM